MKKQRLINALKKMPQEQRDWLEKTKLEGIKLFKKDNFLWYVLLQSFATMGNSRGREWLMKDKNNYQKVSYDNLIHIPGEKVFSHIENVLRESKVRMPQKKAIWLGKNLEFIKKMWGPKIMKEIAGYYKSAECKILFTKQFYWIWDKYARNMWMDAYHPDFHNNIAVDVRIKKILERLGQSIKQYDKSEKFLLDIAHKAGLNWRELDRLLYQYTEYYISKV